MTHNQYNLVQAFKNLLLHNYTHSNNDTNNTNKNDKDNDNDCTSIGYIPRSRLL